MARMIPRSARKISSSFRPRLEDTSKPTSLRFRLSKKDFSPKKPKGFDERSEKSLKSLDQLIKGKAWLQYGVSENDLFQLQRFLSMLFELPQNIGLAKAGKIKISGETIWDYRSRLSEAIDQAKQGLNYKEKILKDIGLREEDINYLFKL